MTKIRTTLITDIETSGLDAYRNEILTLSISACDRNGEIDALELQFRPTSKFWDDEAANIHGISKFQAARFDEPEKSNKLLLEFIHSFPDSILVCHALKLATYFDWGFLQAHFEKIDQRFELYKSIRQCQSTVTWFKYLDRIGYDKNSEYNLKHLCAKYGIELNHHDAQSDRIACQKLFFTVLESLKNLPKEEENGLFLTELFN